MADRTVTITSTKLIIAANGLQIRFYGLDIIEAKPIQKTTPNVNTGAGDWYVDLRLTGEAREVYGAVYSLRLLDVSNKPAWRNDLSGAQAAAAEIAPMIRSTPSGGGGGQVDTIVPGDAIDVDSTDPVNPIVNVKVDGVTIGFNGSNELEVPAGGGGYVPTSRTIGTTAPLTGGGDLSANRTIAIPQANGSTDGFLDSGDWTTFNNKVSSVGATYPIQSSGGATPTISADTSLGGNGAVDSGKMLIFNTQGQIQGSAAGSALAAVKGTASSSSYAVHGEAATGIGVYGQSSSGPGVAADSVTGKAISAVTLGPTEPVLLVKNANAANTAPLAEFHRNDNTGFHVLNDGGLDWDTATGAQTTADNLPVFGALTKGVVPAAGAVPAATNFLDETGNWDAVDVGDLSGLGTGVATALGNNADSASGFVTQTGGDARYLEISANLSDVADAQASRNNLDVPTTVIKTSTTSRVNNTLTADPDLFVTLAANEKISGTITLFIAASAAGDFKYRITGPAGPTSVIMAQAWFTSSGTTVTNLISQAYNSADQTATNASDFLARVLINFSVENGATPGNFAVEWAQNTTAAGNPTSMILGSQIQYIHF